VGNRLVSLTALPPELRVRGLLQKILLQQPPSFSESLNAVLEKILRHSLDVTKEQLEYAIEAHRTQDDHRREPLRFVGALGVLPFRHGDPAPFGCSETERA
jgi:hypothetical protein